MTGRRDTAAGRPRSARVENVGFAEGFSILLRWHDALPPRAAVIIVHGGGVGPHGGTYGKEWAMAQLPLDGLPLLRIYPDLPLHNVRGTVPELRRRFRTDAVRLFFGPAILGLAREISSLVDFVQGERLSPAAPVGVVGWSIGGMASLLAMAADSRIKVAATFGAPSSRADMWTDDYPWDDESRAVMDAMDLHSRVQRFPPRALLLAHGARDALCDPESYRGFYRLLQPQYAACPERLRQLEMEHLGHDPHRAPDPAFAHEPAQLAREIRRWLITHLLETRPEKY